MSQADFTFCWPFLLKLSALYSAPTRIRSSLARSSVSPSTSFSSHNLFFPSFPQSSSTSYPLLHQLAITSTPSTVEQLVRSGALAAFPNNIYVFLAVRLRDIAVAKSNAAGHPSIHAPLLIAFHHHRSQSLGTLGLPPLADHLHSTLLSWRLAITIAFWVPSIVLLNSNSCT